LDVLFVDYPWLHDLDNEERYFKRMGDKEWHSVWNAIDHAAAADAIVIIDLPVTMLAKLGVVLGMSEAEGWRYHTSLVWDREREAGSKNWPRQQHELFAVCSRGRYSKLLTPERRTKTLSAAIRGGAREVARKPDQLYELIEDMLCPGLRKGDIFAREKREGWLAVGDEVDKFNVREGEVAPADWVDDRIDSEDANKQKLVEEELLADKDAAAKVMLHTALDKQTRDYLLWMLNESEVETPRWLEQRIALWSTARRAQAKAWCSRMGARLTWAGLSGKGLMDWVRGCDEVAGALADALVATNDKPKAKDWLGAGQLRHVKADDDSGSYAVPGLTVRASNQLPGGPEELTVLPETDYARAVARQVHTAMAHAGISAVVQRPEKEGWYLVDAQRRVAD
jgi:N6-adenosine-specific RNA methylase IME4